MGSTTKERKAASQRKWYEKNKEMHKARVRIHNAEYVKQRQEWILTYLLDHPCVDCGESDPVVLDFDHVRDVKFKNISRLLKDGPMSVLQDEVLKCDVRCANCHRRKTAKDQNWYSLASVTQRLE